MSRWALVLLLALQVHFAASFLVPLDRQAQGEFWGLLRWLWPWSYGDRGVAGQLAPGADLPGIGLMLAMTATTLYGLALLAAIGVWVPSSWYPLLAAAGAVSLLCLMTLFFGPTKVAPMTAAALTLYLVLGKPAIGALH